MPVPHYDVTAGVIWKNGRVLIAQRPADKLLGGLWEFPGGKREEGETLEACLGRELTEELAIDVEIVRPLTQVEHGFTHFAITLHVFVCRFAGGTPQTLQVADFKWVHPADLGHYALGAADRHVAEFVVSGEAAVANRG
jgi:A/G-specific adenine glycosylase